MDEFEFRPESLEAYSEGEDFEAFEPELADEEWEDEIRRFGRMAGRTARARMRSATRRRPPQRPTRPPQRPPKRPPRPPVRARRPIHSIQEPLNAEPVEQGSEYVRWVQISLNQVLGLRLPITGVMNAAARSALRTFQGQQNLPADGIAGPETRKALVEAKKTQPSSRGDEPAPSVPSQEPSQSAPSEEPSSSGPSQEPSQPEEFEWPGADEFELADETGNEAYDVFAETGEVGLSGLPESVGKALRAGLESVAIKLAVAAGFRDETTLTNLVFTARHPERGGQTLTKGEPGFNELSREWLDIRDRLVRPATRITPTSKAPSSGPADAPAGELDIVSVGRSGIRVARQIAPKVEALLVAAEDAGIRLGGWGYRSRDKQIELRKKHCGPKDKRYAPTHFDIYEKPPSQCTPPTAPPGKSMHEKGLAIDFTYNGKTIKSRNSPAFQWLSRNAEKFGLFNLPSEAWHWSVNGR